MSAECRDVRLRDGSTIRVRGDRPPTQADVDALSDVVDAMRRLIDEMPPEQRAEMERKQRAALDRIHGRRTVGPDRDPNGANP